MKENNTRPWPVFTVTEKAAKTLAAGHPWVYDTEVTGTQPVENGGIVDVISPKGRYLGNAFYSQHSKIRLRVFSRNANDVYDEAFFERRLQWAWNYRKAVMPPEDLQACRVIFGEADGFPGLTVDRMNNLLVAETLSVGTERLKPLLLRLLVDILNRDGANIAGVYERNDAPIRELEGLPQYKGWLALPNLPAEAPSALTEIQENGVRYYVDVENGQKTGFFLDQKYNRRAIRQIAKGRHVLDCFTHTGSFALNAAAAGARQVVAVDASETALQTARQNAALNGLAANMTFIKADVFELLPRLIAEKQEVDLVILDPPAFTKSRKTKSNALRGYKEINTRAMQLLRRGGFLATCSCSHFAAEADFRQMLAEAAAEAGVSLLQVQARQQAPDHPILWGVPETYYLKFFIFQIV